MNNHFEFAKDIVAKAGLRAQAIRSGGLTRKAKALQDFVTEADREIEASIREDVRRYFPRTGVLGEEQGLELPPGASSSMDADGVWILDPIDGTSNFAAGLDAWCVSLAYVQKGIPEIGLVFAPDRRELYTARRGRGASLNGEPLRILEHVHQSHALIMTGRGSILPVAEHLQVIRRLLDAGFEYRRCGSGALGLAQVATGQIQGYVEPGMYPWDVAAARLVVAEAGGELSPFPLENPTTDLGPLVVACQPGLLEILSETVRF